MSDARAAPIQPAYACLFAPPASGGTGTAPPRAVLLEMAQAFSPRYECHGDTIVMVDVTGLERLMRSSATRAGDPSLAPGSGWRTIGQELMRAATEKRLRVHVAIAATRVAALVLAHARPGLTVALPGQEAAALAPVPLDLLAQVADSVLPPARAARRPVSSDRQGPRGDAVTTFKRWGLRTMSELAALPAAELTARLGRPALLWQAIARGDDVRPLVPTEPEERFEGSLELEWPIDGLEPLSFVLTRLLEPLSTQLERRDRGAAVLHVLLDLVSREVHARHLHLPSPLRDVRTLRTLALLDIEAHPPAGAIDRVTVVIDPTPGRVVQHTLFTRALPTPERLSTLLARLGAVMGTDRVGAPAMVETYRPGAFAMAPFSTEPRPSPLGPSASPPSSEHPSSAWPAGARSGDGGSPVAPITALRRCRQPVPARVVVEAGRPVRVTSERRGFTGGAVVMRTGPWRTSGHWWEEGMSPVPASTGPWERDEWDVALSDHARYRVFRDRATDAWFIDGFFD